MKNVLVGQSGGPTAVINSSLAGVYETAKACGAPHVYGMQYGIEGVLEGKLIDLDTVLGDKMDITASQIRQDLSCFGEFGQQGYGYNVKYLYTEIGKILGLNEKHKFVIIGAGNLGQALANYAAFENRGFVLKGLFDVNPRLAGLTIRGVEIRMMDELKDFVKENDIEIGVLTIPKTKAVEVANLLVDNGVKAIWNFAHTDLNLPDNIIVENVHLSESLMRLSYNITRYNEEHEGK